MLKNKTGLVVVVVVVVYILKGTRLEKKRVQGLTDDVILKGLYVSPTFLHWLFLTPMGLFAINKLSATVVCREG